MLKNLTTNLILLSFFIAFYNCNLIPASFEGSTITGKDVKAELKKTAKTNLLFTFSSLNSAFQINQSSGRTIKACAGYTIDSQSPGFTLPSPTDYTNVNLTGSLSSTTTQLWTSTTISSLSNISYSFTSGSTTCRYSFNGIPTSNTGTLIGSSSGTISVESVSSVMNIFCFSSSTTSQTYTLSLNPRPTNASTTNPYSTQFSNENLLSEQLAPAIAGIEDDTVYTQESFDKCNTNYTVILLLYLSSVGSQIAKFNECGINNAPPPQYLVQGFACKLDKAQFIE